MSIEVCQKCPDTACLIDQSRRLQIDLTKYYIDIPRSCTIRRECQFRDPPINQRTPNTLLPKIYR